MYSIWGSLFFGPPCILRTDRPTTNLNFENFKWPYLRKRSSDPLHVWFYCSVFGVGGSNGAIFSFMFFSLLIDPPLVHAMLHMNNVFISFYFVFCIRRLLVTLLLFVYVTHCVDGCMIGLMLIALTGCYCSNLSRPALCHSCLCQPSKRCTVY